MDHEPSWNRLPPGAPLRLPAWMDHLAERWWAATPRARRSLALVGIALLVVAGTVHVGSNPYGPPELVFVAARDLDIGESLTTEVLDRRDWPRSLVPDGALATADGVLRAPLPRGAIATESHVGPDGVATELPAGQVAVAIAVELLPGIEAGTRVSLVASHADGTTGIVAADARVLTTEERSAWIAVSETDAPAVTLAAATATLSVIVLPG